MTQSGVPRGFFAGMTTSWRRAHIWMATGTADRSFAIRTAVSIMRYVTLTANISEVAHFKKETRNFYTDKWSRLYEKSSKTGLKWSGGFAFPMAFGKIHHGTYNR